jgi:hypothetical protein
MSLFPQPDQPELVEGLSFSSTAAERQGFDKLSLSGFLHHG